MHCTPLPLPTLSTTSLYNLGARWPRLFPTDGFSKGLFLKMAFNFRKDGFSLQHWSSRPAGLNPSLMEPLSL